MKKYVKPDIYFESFQLTQHIAACGWDLNAATVESCTSEGDNQKVYSDNNFFADAYGPAFVERNAACKMKTENYCYTPPSDDMIAVFASG